MNLREVLDALRTGWWLPVLGLVLGGGLALGSSLLQTPLYTASTQLFVSTGAVTSSADAFQGGQFTQQRAASYARLLMGEELAGRVVERLNLDLSADALREEVSASAVPGTVLIDVGVTDPSPERARAIAEGIGAEFPGLVEELEPAPGGTPLVRVAVTDAPEVPTAPSSPQVARNVALGLASGALIGALAALARVRLDRSVKDPDDIAELVEAPVIGTVMRDEALAHSHVIVRSAGGRTTEDYRQLRTNLQFLSVDDPAKVIMVSSALPSEGKTTLVINLALALADAGQRVTVVEADLRQPKVTKYLGMVDGVGLTNVLTGTADIEDVQQPYQAGMTVIAAGPHPPNPGELLASSHMSALLAKLRASNDFVLVDAPPLLPVADASGLATAVEGVLLSARYGSTRKDLLQQAARTLEGVGARLLGVVLNIVPPRADTAVAYGYGHSYRRGYDERAVPSRGSHKHATPDRTDASH